ncbi:MAG: hypothetical protein EZS28_014235 [Streblomastix strix]|uniref:Uncharacterized protein n=1 Tax=Streblomastix strix TaxID=222440 RepID=A0A5J4W5S2_9EUKA|nr:MAG: hypothetical protein EZS28_014235 [Streblomastix strix]
MAQTSKNDVGATFERRRQGQKNDVDLRHTAPLGKTLGVIAKADGHKDSFEDELLDLVFATKNNGAI